MEELENETPDELGDVIKENEALAVESQDLKEQELKLALEKNELRSKLDELNQKAPDEATEKRLENMTKYTMECEILL